MEDEDYSSDSSDEDYVPTGADSDVDELSNNSADDSASDDDIESKDSPKGSKEGRKKNKTSKSKKKSNNKASEENEKVETDATGNEDKKERIESLWASFKETPPASTKTTDSPSTSTIEPKPGTLKVYEFAGEKVEIVEEAKATTTQGSNIQKGPMKRPPLRVGGLSSLTSQLGNSKKAKLSTLEKSKLDWDRFKTDEGISEDLKSFNQGKQGFLERQAFLERADLKQFEIEKGLRAGRKT